MPCCPTSMFKRLDVGDPVAALWGRAYWLQRGIRGFWGGVVICRANVEAKPEEALHLLTAQWRPANNVYPRFLASFANNNVNNPPKYHSTSAMDFAPYQDTAPENTRALSPPPRRSLSRSPNPKSPPPNSSTTDPFSSSNLPAPSHFSDDPRGGRGANATGFGNADLESGGGLNVNLFETSLPLRLDYEACLAYLLLPPAGGVFLLVMEHKSDYVRFHAWQSALVFTAMFVSLRVYTRFPYYLVLGSLSISPALLPFLATPFLIL
ncbi:MAG: hypothetical protein Q9214_000050 [Letrouitia sp. 1 TL-2023]